MPVANIGLFGSVQINTAMTHSYATWLAVFHQEVSEVSPALADGLPTNSSGWDYRTLRWADEFTQADGTQPDSSKWGYDIGGSGWGNNELQYYTDRTENARIESDALVVEARAENFGGRNYTSARLLTKDKQSWSFYTSNRRLPRSSRIVLQRLSLSP